MNIPDMAEPKPVDIDCDKTFPMNPSNWLVSNLSRRGWRGRSVLGRDGGEGGGRSGREAGGFLAGAAGAGARLAGAGGAGGRLAGAGAGRRLKTLPLILLIARKMPL